jgi:hypothetical protein
MASETVAVTTAVRVLSPAVINRLTAPGNVPDRFKGLLFVVVLLVCQFSLVLHQLDVEHHTAAQECKICLASQSLDHALATGFLSPLDEAATEPPGIRPASFNSSRTTLREVARSPPVSALHA